MSTSQPHDRSEGDINFTSRRRAWQDAELSIDAWDSLHADAQVFLKQSLSTPCLNTLASASGIYLEDVDGRRYMDFHGNCVHQVGYRHPKVVAALIRQLDSLPFSPRRFANAPATALAERLVSLAPGKLRRVLFTPGGTAAIGIALKLARIVTGRHKVVSMWGAFHGASLDAISVGGEALFRSGIGPLMPGVSHVHPAFPYRCTYGCGGSCNLRCADAIERVLESEGDVGAIIAEPMRCTTVAPPPPGYWHRVREACDRHGSLLIFDEIPTCLGRTGDWFASQTVGVTPDILVIGKGLGGAVMPIAAVMTREDLDVAGHISLGHYTHEKSPIAAAAALATLDVLQEEHLIDRSRNLGERVLRHLCSMQQEIPLIGNVRGAGLLIGVELVLDREKRTPAHDAAERVMYECLSRGLSFKVSSGNVLTLTPPLIISDGELDRALGILHEVLARVDRETPRDAH